MTINLEAILGAVFDAKPEWEHAGACQRGDAKKFYIDLEGEGALSFCEAFADAVLEAAASRLDTAADFSDNRRAVERCAAEVRALKVTP